MSRTLVIPADLALLLRGQALSDYSLACERASTAAERCVCVPDPPLERLDELRECRARVVAADAALDLLGGDIVTATALDVSLEDGTRELITTRVRLALDRVSSDLESSQPEILEAADRIERLRALLDKLAAR